MKGIDSGEGVPGVRDAVAVWVAEGVSVRGGVREAESVDVLNTWSVLTAMIGVGVGRWVRVGELGVSESAQAVTANAKTVTPRLRRDFRSLLEVIGNNFFLHEGHDAKRTPRKAFNFVFLRVTSWKSFIPNYVY